MEDSSYGMRFNSRTLKQPIRFNLVILIILSTSFAVLSSFYFQQNSTGCKKKKKEEETITNRHIRVCSLMQHFSFLLRNYYRC